MTDFDTSKTLDETIRQELDSLDGPKNVLLVGSEKFADVTSPTILSDLFLESIVSHGGSPHVLSTTSFKRAHNHPLVSDDIFESKNRHLLLHEIQRVLEKENIGFIFGFGIWNAGYIASVAAFLAKLPNILIASRSDAYRYHLENPAIFEQAFRNSKYMISTQADVYEHLAAFHDFDGKILVTKEEPIPASEVYPSLRHVERIYYPTAAKQPLVALT